MPVIKTTRISKCIMKKHIYFTIIILFCATASHAMGIGAYYEFSGLQAEITSSYSPPSGLVLAHTGGFILDTAVAMSDLV